MYNEQVASWCSWGVAHRAKLIPSFLPYANLADWTWMKMGAASLGEEY